MENLTFETLPKAVAQLLKEIAEIKAMVLNVNTAPQPDEWFDLAGLIAYLPDKPSKHTVYEWVHNDKIPVHKGGKKLRFLKAEIDEWLKVGRKKTAIEIADANSVTLTYAELEAVAMLARRLPKSSAIELVAIIGDGTGAMLVDQIRNAS